MHLSFRIPAATANVFFRILIPEADIKRKIAMLLTALVLLVVGVLGTINGITEWSDAGLDTFWKRSVVVASLIYGILALIAGVGVLLRRRWSVSFAIAWGIFATYCGTTATLAWAEAGQPVVRSAAFALVLSALMVGLVTWGAYAATRADR